MRDLAAELARLRTEHRYRSRAVADGPQGVEITVDGARYLSFCSNDYLGLANDPRVIAALKEGADKYGAGSGASHLVTGHQRPHHELEEALAAFTGRPRALLFSTGYMANLGTVAALAGRGDALFEDRLNHASLLDAGLLSGARLRRYAHNDVNDLTRRLNAQHEPSPPPGFAPLATLSPHAGEGGNSPSPASGRRVWDEGADASYMPRPPARLPADLLNHARNLRHKATDAEQLLWHLLRNRRLAGAKFRRQHPIGPYIADFHCNEYLLVIELDGGQHSEQKNYDAQRTAFLQAQGLTVLRFWNNQILSETEAVLEAIWNHVANYEQAPSPPAGFAPLATLSPHAGEGSASKTTTLIITDGVFSMDGDLAPLPQLAAVAQRYDAWLMVDDAHGLGVLGKHGRGVLEQCALTHREVPILIGTLGKAFGTFGAFAAGSEDLIEYLIQRARPYIYTTALPPAVAHATLASLRLVQEEGWRREHLNALIARFRRGAAQLGANVLPSDTPIQALIAGDSAQALALSAALRQRGIYVAAIRPPTVPTGTARLRITLSAAHSEAHVDRLLAALEATL